MGTGFCPGFRLRQPYWLIPQQRAAYGFSIRDAADLVVDMGLFRIARQSWLKALFQLTLKGRSESNEVVKTNKSCWACEVSQNAPVPENPAAFALCPATLVAGKTDDERRALQEMYRTALELRSFVDIAP